MPDLAAITPLVLTLDEAPNIGRTLERLTWADRVVVLDSGSTDDTVEIAKGFENADVVQRDFDSHAAQWNYGLGQVRTPWVLTLDADYVLGEGLIEEVEALPDEAVSGYSIRFRYRVLGRTLDRSLYPPRVALFRCDRGRFEQDGHTQRAVVDGSIGELERVIIHDDRKPLRRWIRNQVAYAAREAEKLRSTPRADLSTPDRLRKSGLLGVPLVTLYCLFRKGLIFEGRAGLYYTTQRIVAEAILSLMLLGGAGDETSSARPEEEDTPITEISSR